MRKLSVRKRVLHVAICVFMLAVPVVAQDAGLAGSVTDATGALLPGVTVEITGPALDAPSIAITDGNGAYAVAVPAGSYTVSFALPGFALLERERVLVSEGATTALDIELQISALATQVSVVATGTAIAAPAINLSHAVAVVGRETLADQGAAQLVDLFRNIGASHGVIGERNSCYNSDQPATLTETIANVNLRGLGASRTLVLFNGRRQTYVPARLIGGRFVDINAMPAVAIDRIEVLKEGAAATYGSDAVAGVANFVTRGDFRGFELNVTHDHFVGAGDSTVSGIWGGSAGASNLGRVNINEHECFIIRHGDHTGAVLSHRAGTAASAGQRQSFEPDGLERHFVCG